jgi:hypothetical protein
VIFIYFNTSILVSIAVCYTLNRPLFEILLLSLFRCSARSLPRPYDWFFLVSSNRVYSTSDFPVYYCVYFHYNRFITWSNRDYSTAAFDVLGRAFCVLTFKYFFFFSLLIGVVPWRPFMYWFYIFRAALCTFIYYKKHL